MLHKIYLSEDQVSDLFITDNWPESPFNKKTSNGTYDEEDAIDELNL